jgi:osmotically-inducible protein OsmY
MRSKTVVSRLLAVALLVGAGWAAAPVFTGSSSVLAADVTSAVQKQLRGKNFKGVTVAADNGTVTLSGQVDLYAYKEQAEKKAKKVSGVSNVQNNITVGGPDIADNVLQNKLQEKIQTDRIGFGQAFSAIGVNVHNGVATLVGHAVGPIAANSAVALTENMPGVKGVVNQIQVDPISPLDNGIRERAYRAIYGYAPLQRYAAVPSKPIRISVQNGHLTLYGAVDSEADKQMVGMRAKQVPNVFSVTNDLVVQH